MGNYTNTKSKPKETIGTLWGNLRQPYENHKTTINNNGKP